MNMIRLDKRTDKMKRTHTYPALLALLLTVAFASCRQEPLPEGGDAIRFSVSAVDISASETKSVSIPPTDGSGLISDGSSALLFGSLTGSTDPVFAAGTTLNCSKPSSIATWSYTNGTKYWVKGGTYSFKAVYPATASVDASQTSGDKVVVNYDMADNYDLMVGAASVTAAPPTDNTVTLQFGHACTAVRFLFTDVSGNVDTGESNIITHFELQNLVTNGVYTSPATNPWALGSVSTTPVYSWTGSWTVPIAADPTAVVPADYASIGSAPAWYFVIPQSLGDTAALYFEYSVGTGTDAKKLSATINLKAESITNWDARMVYTYKIKIQNTIGFEVGWTLWDKDLDEYDLTGQIESD